MKHKSTQLWNKIADPSRTFIIAEAGVNHNGDLKLAKRLIDAAVRAGCDAVKFQTFKTERLVTPEAPKAEYQKKNSQSVRGESQFEMLKRLELSVEAHEKLFTYCQEKNIVFLSTPFDEESAEFLDRLGVEVFKIPSGEITNIPFLKYVAGMKKPIILSTGMSTLKEVQQAFGTIQEEGNAQVILLHCVSNYPTRPKDVNLKAIETLKKEFQVPVGFSDHTLGIEIPLAAVALGAKIIEKHFTLDCSWEGPDHKSSLEPSQLKALVDGIRKIESALGDGQKKPAQTEHTIARVARKSLVASVFIKKGTALTEDMISIKRPGTGLLPSMRTHLVGRTAKKDISADELFSWEQLS